MQYPYYPCYRIPQVPLDEIIAIRHGLDLDLLREHARTCSEFQTCQAHLPKRRKVELDDRSKNVSNEEANSEHTAEDSDFEYMGEDLSTATEIAVDTRF